METLYIAYDRGLKNAFLMVPHMVYFVILVTIQRQFINVQYCDASKVVNMVRIGESICNGYGIWINKTKLRDDLIMFNRLPEPWRASPESWHLSRIYYIHSIITFTLVENISWELALKPGYHNTIVQYT